jgi:hypothetical protein
MIINWTFYIGAMLFCIAVGISTGSISGFLFIMLVFSVFGKCLLTDDN